MANWKFKIGDVVQVVKCVGETSDEALDSRFNVGHRGTIKSCIIGENYPYEVQRKNRNAQVFNVKELKLIRKGK